MVTRTPSPANGRTITPAASQAAANGDRPLAQRQPDEVGLARRHVRHQLAQRALDPVALGHDQVGPAGHLVLGRSAASAAAWATSEVENGRDHLAHGGGHLGLRDQVADPQAGQAPRLGQRAQHDHVGPVAVAREAVRHVAGR